MRRPRDRCYHDLIDSDAELGRACALVDRLWESDEPADMAWLQAQPRLIAAYEENLDGRRVPRISSATSWSNTASEARHGFRSSEQRAASVRSYGGKQALSMAL